MQRAGLLDRLFTRALEIDGTMLGTIMGIALALLAIGGVWVLWLGYGSAHRGQVPLLAPSARPEEPVA